MGIPYFRGPEGKPGICYQQAKGRQEADGKPYREGGSIVMPKHRRYNLQDKVKFPLTNDIKSIIIDSLYAGGYRKRSHTPEKAIEDEIDSESINNYIKANVDSYKNKGPYLFYNYIVDRCGDIYELFPIGFDTLSVSKGDYLTRGVVSIATLSMFDQSDADDPGYMTSECSKSLYKLIVNILIRLRYESGIRLTGSCLSLRCHYIECRPEDNVGHIYFKKHAPQFMALKRNVTRGLMDISMIKNNIR
jgi:hypothetical protein